MVIMLLAGCMGRWAGGTCMLVIPGCIPAAGMGEGLYCPGWGAGMWPICGGMGWCC